MKPQPGFHLVKNIPVRSTPARRAQNNLSGAPAPHFNNPCRAIGLRKIEFARGKVPRRSSPLPAKLIMPRFLTPDQTPFDPFLAL
jgi:hypothetical protein